MAPRKTGLIGKLKQFMEALSDRYQRVLQIIDEALASEDFKEKKWAVDLILKGGPDTAEKAPARPKPSTAPQSDPLPAADISLLSDEELVRRIRTHLEGGGQRDAE